MGVVLAQSGRLSDAVDVWKDGWEQWQKNPILGDDPVILNLNIGVALKNMGKSRLAGRSIYLSFYLYMGCTAFQITHLWGTALQMEPHSGRYEEALEYLETCLRYNRNYAACHDRMREVKQMMKR